MRKVSKFEFDSFYDSNPYRVVSDDLTGLKAVDVHTVRRDVFNWSDGNSKVGDHVGNYNLPIAFSCVRDCECHSKKKCYACSGTYNFLANQARYSENMAYLMSHTIAEFVSEMVDTINENSWDLFRYFTCGDIPFVSFVGAMVDIARQCPTVRFWVYTKKYSLVNAWCDKYGVDSIPNNLTVIFSHWRNEDGTFYPMDNPYYFPTSEFIPVGCENELVDADHVCPCSDPDVLATCKVCEHPCYELKQGQKMALLEHSTTETKDRDRALKQAHAELKKAKRAKKSA